MKGWIRYLKSILLVLFGYLSFISAAQSHINFDENWKFHLGHAADAAKDFNYSVVTIFSKTGKSEGTAISPKFDDRNWRTLDLPHDWAVELPFVFADNFDVMAHGYKPVGGLFPQNSVGWYRKHFSVSKADSGQRLSIRFDGVFRDSRVWLNGFYLGRNESGYIGATYDITDYLEFNKENIIVVRVDASQYEGWFYEGAGIYRHVWLNKNNNVHVPPGGLFIHTRMSGNQARIFTETKLINQGYSAAACTMHQYVTDRSGKKLVESKPVQLSLAVNGEKVTKNELIISGFRKWALEDPYLYRLVTIVRQNGKTIDSLSERFGIRNIDIKPNGVFLNGKHIKLQGVNCHQDHAGVGSALPDYLQYYRISLLKEMGVNAYRTSHNPPAPELLDACDSLGMLVMDETRLLNSSPEYMSQFERMILRDRNHPSVFMWSIGNEEGWVHTTPVGKRIALSLLTKQKALDPTRTSTYAADVGNVYQGINEVIPVRSFNYRHTAVADYHRDHPTQPIVGTEMGSTVTTRGIYVKDTVRAYVPDQDITFPWWASTAEAWWPLAAENDFWLGGFVWTGLDYRGEPTPYQWPNINSHFGIMDMCGFPKNIYYYYQSWWTDKDVLHISPHWNFGKEGEAVDVWVNSNADNVELFLNGKSLGKKDMPRNRHLQWSVIYAPGRLEAIAFKRGKKLTAKVETTGKATEVVITPYKTTMLADGKDATVINVHVIDRQGRQVPDANNLIRFSISGDARIIGVANGDPSSHEPDKCEDGKWQRHLFNGKCQVIIQSGKSAGLIKFEAKADSLWTGSTDIQTVAPGSSLSVTIDNRYKAPVSRKIIGQMLGADISFLPELEDKGIKFQDKGVQKDAIEILKDHGFNYVRLRIFNDPARDSGYSPGKGFCDITHTLAMAKRVKNAGMKLLLDFHYSDYWADPGKQFKPAAWRGLSFNQLKKAMYDYTRNVILQLKAQGTTPDMVQVGNEINHGIIWPEGNVSHLDSLAQLINAGTAAVRSVDTSIIMMLHVALGGQNSESVWFIDNMLARGVPFDVIGQSYYPKWHGTLDDLRDNLNDLVRRYNTDVIVVEYSQLKNEVNKIAFELPDGRGKGTCIWEPLNTWEMVFDRDGKSNDYLKMYDEIARKYLISGK
jgi:beta-galactosidase